MLTIMFGVQRLAPGIGIFDPLIGLMSPWYWFYLVLAFGLALNIFLIIVLKTWWLKRKEAKLKDGDEFTETTGDGIGD